MGEAQWLVQQRQWSDTKLIAALNRGRASSMSMGLWGNDAQVMLAQKSQLIQRLANSMGYDFVITRATLPDTITRNQASRISLLWKNQGVAYLTRTAYVAVALLDGSDTAVQLVWLPRANPQLWTPGRVSIMKAALKFAGVRAGAYRLA